MSKVKGVLSSQVVLEAVDSLTPYPNNPRSHPLAQIKAIQASLKEFGFGRPIGIDENKTILFGHGCVEAAKQLGFTHVPTVMLKGLSEAKKRALVIADNRLAEHSSWDISLLKVHFDELLKVDFDLDLTGFSAGRIDILLATPQRDEAETDERYGIPATAAPVSKEGDLWVLGRHRLICGNALNADPYHALLGADRVEMMVTDPPYNVQIQGHARGRSRTAHREFAMASGEMSSPGFTGFLEGAMRRAVEFSVSGSIHYWCMDWRHLPELLRAGLPLYSEWKNLLVWRKSNAGQGSFYRSHHELIAVFKAGTGPHINNFGLGSEGRYRTNVLDYPGGATPDARRQEELQMHPTVKPVALIADLMRDCSKRNGLVLDPFGGSGTAILAAEETGRRARVIELDPRYVDLAVRRWQKQTGDRAVHEPSGRRFDEMPGSDAHNG
jgi:DNA modification methylase